MDSLEVRFLNNGIQEFIKKTFSFRCFVVPKESIKYCNQEIKNKMCVYFLINSKEGLYSKRMLYIGQTSNFENRMNDHIAKKDWWDCVIVFCANKPIFNSDIIFGLERLFIRDYSQSNLYILKNSKGSDYDVDSDCYSFKKNIEEFLSFFRYGLDEIKMKYETKSFSSDDKKQVNSYIDEKSNSYDVEVFLDIQKDNVHANGIYNKKTGTLTVLKGSRISVIAHSSFDNNSQKMLADLKMKGIVSKELFVLNHEFASPSTAAKIVGKSSLNGWKVWKNKSGLTLDTIVRRKTSSLCSLDPKTNKCTYNYSNKSPKEELQVFYFQGKLKAKMIKENGSFILLKGSEIRNGLVKSARSSVIKDRQKYEQYILDDKTVCDIPFSSPSAASAFVAGRTSNGNIDWKTKDGKSPKA